MAKSQFRMVTTQNQITKYVEARLARAKALQIQILDMAGELAVRDQTLRHKYLNQTGNLSSSIGFVVLDNGRVVAEGGFEKTNEGAEGQREGNDFIKSLAAQNRQGLVLIIVAGMNYALYVENMGLDVLTTAELTADKMVKQLLKAL